MSIKYLDHVNIRTTDLTSLQSFYEDVLGFQVGPRPDFPFPGAWLYCGERPVVHLVGVADPPSPPNALSLEHFAFAAEGLAEFLGHLRQHRVAYRVVIVPTFNTRQVNFHDSMGNHLHVDFGPEEQADLAPFDP